jgi:hypothetical protein
MSLIDWSGTPALLPTTFRLSLLLPQKLCDRAELHPKHVCTCCRCSSIITNISEDITAALMAFMQQLTCFVNIQDPQAFVSRTSYHTGHALSQETVVQSSLLCLNTFWICCSIICTLWISRGRVAIRLQQADVPNKAGVIVSCRTIMHAQVTGVWVYLCTTNPGRSSGVQQGAGGGGMPTGTSQ